MAYSKIEKLFLFLARKPNRHELYLAVLVPWGQNKVAQSQIHGGITGKFWKLIKLIKLHHIRSHTQSLAALVRLVEGLKVWTHAWNWGTQSKLIHHVGLIYLIPTSLNSWSNGTVTVRHLLCGWTALQWSALSSVRDTLLGEPEGLIPTQSG